MTEETETPRPADVAGRLDGLVGQLCAAGWSDANNRPNDGQFVAYLFEPFMCFYCGEYDKGTDSVAGKHGFTSWQPEVLVWFPLPPNTQLTGAPLLARPS